MNDVITNKIKFLEQGWRLAGAVFTPNSQTDFLKKVLIQKGKNSRMPSLVKSGPRMNINSFLSFFDLSLSINLHNITRAAKMMGRIGFIASTLLFRVILMSEFDESIYNLISNSLEGASPEFFPTEFDPLPAMENPATSEVTRTPTIVRRFFKNSDTDRVYFPSSRPLDYGYKPSVESIRIYECGNFFMKCEFRQNFDVEYPLHCKMVTGN